ncbi:MAG: hypothetical protein AAGI17_08295 [Planctomycetota bacterium]
MTRGWFVPLLRLAMLVLLGSPVPMVSAAMVEGPEDAPVVLELHRTERIAESEMIRDAAGLIVGRESVDDLDAAWRGLLRQLRVEDAWQQGQLLAGPLTIAVDRFKLKNGETAWTWTAIAPIARPLEARVRSGLGGKLRGTVHGRAKFALEDGRYQAATLRASDGSAVLVLAPTRHGAKSDAAFAASVLWAADRERFGQVSDIARVDATLRLPRGVVELRASDTGGRLETVFEAPAETLGLVRAAQRTWSEGDAERLIGDESDGLAFVGSAAALDAILRLPGLLNWASPVPESLELSGMDLPAGRLFGSVSCDPRVGGDEHTVIQACVESKSSADSAMSVVLAMLGSTGDASRLRGRFPHARRHERITMTAGTVAGSLFGSAADVRWGPWENGPEPAALLDDGSSWWAASINAGTAELRGLFEPVRRARVAAFVRTSLVAEDIEPTRRVITRGVLRPGLLPASLVEALGGAWGIGELGGTVSWDVRVDRAGVVRAELVYGGEAPETTSEAVVPTPRYAAGP